MIGVAQSGHDLALYRRPHPSSVSVGLGPVRTLPPPRPYRLPATVRWSEKDGSGADITDVPQHLMFVFARFVFGEE